MEDSPKKVLKSFESWWFCSFIRSIFWARFTGESAGAATVVPAPAVPPPMCSLRVEDKAGGRREGKFEALVVILSLLLVLLVLLVLLLLNKVAFSSCSALLLMVSIAEALLPCLQLCADGPRRIDERPEERMSL